MSAPIKVVLVPASAVRPLRHRVLRPTEPVESVQYPEDSVAGARHYAVYQEGQVVAIASVFPEAEPGETETGVWRLRGMASSPEVRGTGLGKQVLAFLLSDLKARGAARVWCNARVTVAGFYENHGFAAESEIFEMAGIGPHVVMKARF